MIRHQILDRHGVTVIVGVLVAMAGGCADNTKYDGQDQQSAANQQAARTAAYGNPNNPAQKKVKGKGASSPEAAARQRAGH